MIDPPARVPVAAWGLAWSCLAGQLPRTVRLVLVWVLFVATALADGVEPPSWSEPWGA